jgi:DNA-binding MarR family transcriptional regulator
MPRDAEAEERAAAVRCVRVLVRALGQSARAVEHRTGITNAQLFILQQLATAGGLSINELADRALTGQNTVSAVVARLAGKGLVHRARATHDGRRAIVTLTAAGRRLVRRAPEPPTARLLTALGELPASSVSGLARDLQALVLAMRLPDTLPGMLFEDDAEPTRAQTAGPARRPRSPGAAAGRRKSGRTGPDEAGDGRRTSGRKA